MHLAAIVRDTIARFLIRITFTHKRIFSLQIVWANRRFPGTTGNI